ncbi:MAG: septal ring lytic transglycosylase RlpA family protein [Candidatus Methylomirabilia bacterium]
MNAWRAWGLLLLVVLSGCAAPRVVVRPISPLVGAQQTGKASWYGFSFHGRRTASGEVYNMYQLTAAHRTLPLGTVVLVTNLRNGRSVQVRINDRGPFVAGRIIDLSYAAARLLGAVKPGVIPVHLRVVAAPGRVSSRRAVGYAVQVGAFTDPATAEALRANLAPHAGRVAVSPRVVGGVTYYRVQVGPYASRESAVRFAEQLAARGYPVLVVETE